MQNELIKASYMEHNAVVKKLGIQFLQSDGEVEKTQKKTHTDNPG